LPRIPLGGRMRCRAEPYHMASAALENQQAIEQPKLECRNDEEIHRGDPIGVVAKDCLPRAP
jgi:hypothetical protein